MSREISKQPIDLSVGEFLTEFKKRLKLRHPPIKWDDQPKRRAELLELEITRQQVIACLQKLEVRHHSSGPERDHWEDVNPSVVHVFRFPLERGLDVYVKIGLVEHAKYSGLLEPKVWSFKRWVS